MTERPILFSGEMVKAILEGRKTQTRRITGLDDVNKYPGSLIGQCSLGLLGYRGLEVSDYYLNPPAKKQFKKEPGLWHWFLGEQSEKREINPIVVKCPYGVPGDRLWVRETCKIDCMMGIEPYTKEVVSVTYRAGGIKQFDHKYMSEKTIKGGMNHWTPSIFMPRWASRITLEIGKVRVERLQEIILSEIGMEGVKWPGETWGKTGYFENEFPKIFGRLWDSINAKRGFPWESNPWVWVIEFKKVEA